MAVCTSCGTYYHGQFCSNRGASPPAHQPGYQRSQYHQPQYYRATSYKQYPQHPYPPPVYHPPPYRQESDASGTVSLVLGIIGILGTFMMWGGFVFGIIAIITGYMAKKRASATATRASSWGL